MKRVYVVCKSAQGGGVLWKITEDGDRTRIADYPNGFNALSDANMLNIDASWVWLQV